MEVQSSTLSKKKEQIKDIINFSTVISYLCAWKGKERKRIVFFRKLKKVQIQTNLNKPSSHMLIVLVLTPYILSV